MFCQICRKYPSLADKLSSLFSSEEVSKLNTCNLPSDSQTES